MTPVIGMDSSVSRIVNALGLKDAVSATIDIRLNSAVTVKVEQYVSRESLDGLSTILEENEYVLVPKKEADAALLQMQLFVDTTDPWCGSKCVTPVTTPEARVARGALLWLRKAITGSTKR